MKALWLRLATRFAAFSLRERAMIAAALIGGVLLVGSALLVDPVAARNKMMQQGIERQSAELAGLQAQLDALEVQSRTDPDAARKAEIQGLQTTLQGLAQRLKTATGGLVPPERMNGLLETLLARHPGLRLVSLKTLKPTGILAGQAGKADDKAELANRDFDIYRHGVEIRLEGSFAELHAYLAQLEQEQPGLLWGDARLTVEEHPKALLTVVVYTLSSDKAWLAI